MLRSQVDKEIQLGFQFIFDSAIINLIPNLIVCSYGVAMQNTINKLMEIITKY